MAATVSEECLERIAARGSMGKKEAVAIVEQVAERAEQMRRSGEMDPFVYAAHELAQKLKEAARLDKLEALRSAAKRNEVLDRIEREGGISAAANVLRSVLHWVPKATRLDSIEGLWHSVSRSWQAVVGNELRQAGIEKAARSGALDYEAAEEIWGRNFLGPEPLGPRTQGRQLADALKPALDLAKERLNAAGARIGSAVDYVTHTNWNPRQLRLAAGPGKTADEAFAAWWKAEEPRMADKTFEHLVPAPGETMDQAKLKFARSVFDATASGVHMEHPGLSGMADDGNGYIPPAWEGTHNIGRAVSQQRTIFWKDARSWTDHMKEFGGGDSLWHQVSRTLDISARRLALMERLGTNPDGNFNLIVRRVEEKHRQDLDGLADFQKKIHGLNNVMDRLTGAANMPANAEWAERVDALMTLEATAHLGGVAATHVAAAPATLSAEMVHHGVGHLQTVANVAKALVTGRGPAELQEVMAEAGAYSHGYNLMLHNHWKDGGGIPGFMSWAASNFMKLTGLPRFLDQFQAKAVKSVLMTKLGAKADGEFSALEPHQAALLQRYGIGPAEWDVLRSSPEPFMVEGQRYITPRDASLADPAKVEAMLRAQGKIADDAVPQTVDSAVKKGRWDLADGYGMYLNDAAEHSTVTPGVRERAMVYGTNRPGSLGWMIARVVTQFKMWPLAAVNQIIGREIGYALSGKEIASNIGWLLALSAAGGAARMAVNDAMVGRPQRNYAEPMTLLAALAQGGGLGIYGDFLFGETSRMGAGLVATTMGPIASDADRLIQMANRFRQDIKTEPGKAMKHMWPDLAHFAVGHFPYANLIYLKGALDYMLWYHLYEAASPGWWERSNRRLQKEQGRTMTGYAPGASIPWSPWGIGAGR